MEARPDLIVLDNLFTLCRSGDRNDSQSWEAMQEFLLDQRSRGRSVLVVHHTNKSNSYHGTVAQTVVMDTVVSLTPPKEKSSQGARFVLGFEKSRNLVGEDAASMQVSVIQSPEDPGGITGFYFEKPEETAPEAAVRLLRSGRYGNQEELGAALGINRTTAGRHLKKAIEQGLITPAEIEECFAKDRSEEPGGGHDGRHEGDF